MAAPRFAISSVVYVRESAALGFLESMQITGMLSDGAWMYTFDERPAPPAAIPTTTDRYQALVAKRRILPESELVTYLEALNLCLAHATRVKAKIEAMIAAVE